MKQQDRFESSWSSRTKLSLFANPSERRLYDSLRTRYKGRMIAPQVSFSALFPPGQMRAMVTRVVDSRCPERVRRTMDYLAKSRVDFVIYDHRGLVEVVIESNGSSHRRRGRQRRDLLKAELLRELGVPLISYGWTSHLSEKFRE